MSIKNLFQDNSKPPRISLSKLDQIRELKGRNCDSWTIQRRVNLPARTVLSVLHGKAGADYLISSVLE